MNERKRLWFVNWPLIGLVSLLCMFGSIMVQSATSGMTGGPGLFKRHLIGLAIGLVPLAIAWLFDYRQLSGPIGIASVSGQVLVVFGVVALINLAAVLSVSIGLLNLFPIPMLDGGHLLYYGIEAVRGRPLGERAQELGFQIGFVLVISLMLFATWNDLTTNH